MDLEDLQEPWGHKGLKVKLVLLENLVTWGQWVELETVALKDDLERLVKMVNPGKQDEVGSRDSWGNRVLEVSQVPLASLVSRV